MSRKISIIMLELKGGYIMILFTKITTKDRKDLVVFNDYFRNREDELRKILITFKPECWVDKILSEGVFQTEDEVFKFSSDGKITKQYKDGTDWYRPYYKGDAVWICSDANVKKCTISRARLWLFELKGNIEIACSELDDALDDVVEEYFI